MHLRVACLVLLAAVAVSAQDLMSVHYLELRAFRPGNGYDTLGIYVFYSGPPSADYSINQLVLYTSLPGDFTIDHTLAVVNRTGLYKISEENDFLIGGELWQISVHWHTKTDGYCRAYQARVLGVDSDGNEISVDKTLNVRPFDGSGCEKYQVPEDIQNAFPDATYREQWEILDKLRAIDTNAYDVSPIYSGRVYLASKDNTHFELHKMNELCKSAGGYLLEMDDLDEQLYVRDFLKGVGSYNYYTGGNDVENEGHFSYYNSKKPMTNVKWEDGEPNNSGNEDCVEIHSTGLNDNQCGREHGYICEIPLV